MTDEGLVDSFGRRHTSLRVSVTDRCNIRCFYCMPNEHIEFKSRHELLTFEEIERIVSVIASLGVQKIRITGGEPLVRSQIWELIERLKRISGIEEVALTTNGILLASQAQDLHRCGLDRLNVSLDALSDESFRRIARRDGLQQVLEGIFAAKQAGFEKIRLNAVSLPGISEEEAVPLARFARDHGFHLRFIEFMPLDAQRQWQDDRMLSGARVRAILEAEFGPLRRAPRKDPSQPATDYQFADGRGIIGFINSVSEPFCQKCNRLRVTAEGQLRNCLFSTVEWDLRALVRAGGTNEEMAVAIRECVSAKRKAHGIGEADFVRPQRAMYQIGG